MPKEYLEEVKRRRCAEAMAELAHEKGLGQVLASDVIKTAHVARTTFYSLFESREGACEYSCALARAELIAALDRVVEVPGERRERVERAIGALLIAVTEAPRMAELCLVHSLVLPQDPPGLHDPETVAVLAEAIAPEVPGTKRRQARKLDIFAAEAIVSVVATRLRRDRADELLAMRDQLIAVTMAWFEAEAAAPAPAVEARARAA